MYSLIEAIKLYSQDKGWFRVSRYVGTKSSAQIKHYVKCNLTRKNVLKQTEPEQEVLELCKSRKVIRWSQQEKDAFDEGVALYGTDWK